MTIVDVAVRAGVALGTVSRVINNKESVAPALRERVNEAARALGYVPNSVAQSMRTQSTQVVGCMVSDISNPCSPPQSARRKRCCTSTATA